MAVVHLKGAEFKSVVQFISYQFIRVYTDLTQLIDFINIGKSNEIKHLNLIGIISIIGMTCPQRPFLHSQV
jgi:hypothetical protein